MPFMKLRSIPKAAKDAMRRATPNDVLMRALSTMELTFPLNKEFVTNVVNKVKPSNPSGYEPPLGGTQELPFHISRTKAGSLPVYADYKNGRTRALTIVRKVSGDPKLLQAELTRITKEPVQLKAGGLEIHGNHLRLVRLWLRGLGF